PVQRTHRQAGVIGKLRGWAHGRIASRLSALLRTQNATAGANTGRTAMTPSVLQHLLTQIVYFYQSNAGRIVHATHDRGVVTRWQLRDNCRLPYVARSVPAVHDVVKLACGDNPADYRNLPVIISGN